MFRRSLILAAGLSAAAVLGFLLAPSLTLAQNEGESFSFHYLKSGGIAGIQKEVSYDSETGTLRVHDSIAGSRERTLAPQDASKLKSIINENNFFEISESFPPTADSADYFSYSLSVRTEQGNHTVSWVDPFASSRMLPDGLIEISKTIEQLALPRDDANIHPSLGKERITGTLVLTSEPHNAEGHSLHEAAYLLYPQVGYIYNGKFTFSASKPVDIIVYHDVTVTDAEGSVHRVGERSYTASTILQNVTSGTVDAVGSAILAHTHDSEPYTVIASIDALRKDTTIRPSAPGTTFTVDVVGERFQVRVTDRQTMSQMFDNYYGRNDMHVTGVLVKGSGGFNEPWSWHLDPDSVRMAEASIELCDGRPSSVEEELDYWLNNVGRYCPWSSEVVSIGNEDLSSQ